MTGPNRFGRERGSAAEVFAAFLLLGLRSFGGPVAHIGYFRAEFVGRRRWVDEAVFADLFALSQFMPGPASSQLGMGLGLLRAGAPGLLAAWLGFTLPSALLMGGFAYGVAALGDVAEAPWLKGLKLVAVAVVAQAVWGMARTLAPDRLRATLAVLGALVTLSAPAAVGQVAAIALGAVAGLVLLRGDTPAAPDTAAPRVAVPRRVGIFLLLVFVVLLAVLPVLPGQTAAMIAAFYRTGALVFGGGHVMLPLLQAWVVVPGWVSNDTFLAGYGAAQALPGPLSSFAAYLGVTMEGWMGGVIATVAIFFPSFLLVGGLLPFWDTLRRRRRVQAALRGVNASVVGVLLAALFTPVWTSAVHNAADFGVGLSAFLLLTMWAVPPWLVVALGAAAAAVLALIGVGV